MSRVHVLMRTALVTRRPPEVGEITRCIVMPARLRGIVRSEERRICPPLFRRAPTALDHSPYNRWTHRRRRSSHLRHSKFVALRNDQDVRDVGRELPTTK
jgi:hypothetical protein